MSETKNQKPIALAADHGGYELKEAIKSHLADLGLAAEDYGTFGTESCDYPDFAARACKAVQQGSSDFAILYQNICNLVYSIGWIYNPATFNQCFHTSLPPVSACVKIAIRTATPFCTCS